MKLRSTIDEILIFYDLSHGGTDRETDCRIIIEAAKLEGLHSSSRRRGDLCFSSVCRQRATFAKVPRREGAETFDVRFTVLLYFATAKERGCLPLEIDSLVR